MEELFKQAGQYLREHKEYRRWLSVFLCLAVVIAAGTVALLTRPGVAMTRTETILDCRFDGVAAHTHTEDCYENGVLVCPLPERELHAHDESCYQTETFLICGLEESEGHVHDASCLTQVRGDLICGLEESEGHVHDASCLTQSRGELICGLEE